MASKLVKASLLTAVFAGAAALTACSPSPPKPLPPPPPHNQYNITMHCLGRTEKFEGVDLQEGISLYHIRRYDVVDGNKLQLSFEKNFRKLGCTMERERVVAEPPALPPQAAPGPTK